MLHPRREVWPELVEAAEEMCREVKERRAASALLGNAAFTRLVALLWWEACETGVLAQPLGNAASEQPWVRPALDYIRKHYAETMTLGQLAGVAHLSRASTVTVWNENDERQTTPDEDVRLMK